MERLRVEYKVKLTQEVLDGIDTDIASFANTEGGEICFGIDNRGNTIGAELTDSDRQRIAQRAARCRPPVPIDFEEREREAKIITLVMVPKSVSIHMDERHRVPIRIGGITDYLDVVGILLLARERGLEFGSGPALPTWQPSFKVERTELPSEVADHILAALRSSNSNVRIEIVTELESMIYQYRVEEHGSIMHTLIEGAIPISKNASARPFDLLRYLLVQASQVEKEKWVPLIREKALALFESCTPAHPASLLQQGINFLSEFPDPRDLEVIARAIAHWPKELYAQARPLPWLGALKSKGYSLDVQRKLIAMLEDALDQETTDRIKGALDHLRRT